MDEFVNEGFKYLELKEYKAAYSSFLRSIKEDNICGYAGLAYLYLAAQCNIFYDIDAGIVYMKDALEHEVYDDNRNLFLVALGSLYIEKARYYWISEHNNPNYNPKVDSELLSTGENIWLSLLDKGLFPELYMYLSATYYDFDNRKCINYCKKALKTDTKENKGIILWFLAKSYSDLYEEYQEDSEKKKGLFKKKPPKLDVTLEQISELWKESYNYNIITTTFAKYRRYIICLETRDTYYVSDSQMDSNERTLFYIERYYYYKQNNLPYKKIEDKLINQYKRLDSKREVPSWYYKLERIYVNTLNRTEMNNTEINKLINSVKNEREEYIAYNNLWPHISTECPHTFIRYNTIGFLVQYYRNGNSFKYPDIYDAVIEDMSSPFSQIMTDTKNELLQQELLLERKKQEQKFYQQQKMFADELKKRDEQNKELSKKMDRLNRKIDDLYWW